MKTTWITMTATLALAAGMASAEEVRVYNWSDYIDEDLLTKFEEETGYDVVVPTGTFLQRQITAGAFQPLDKDKLPNLANMWDTISTRTAAYDPDNAHSINYMWGTTGIGVNVGKVKEVLGEDAPLGSLDLIFKPENMEKLADCGVHFLDAPAEMVPMALKFLGEDPNSHDPEVIAKVEAVYAGVRPYIQKFHSSEYIEALANGDICVATGWSGDVLQARDRADEAENGNEIAYYAPVEGAQMWFDQMAIPVDAPNPDGAHAFLNFIMDAENAAAATNYVWYPVGNLAAQEFIDQEILDDTSVYPDAATLENLFTTTPYPQKVQRDVTRLWTKIKSGI